MIKKKQAFIIINLILSIIIFLTPSFTKATTKIEINATSAIVIDAKTGQIIYEKNPHMRCYPASITKILTALIALEKEKDLNKIFYVSKKAVNIPPGSTSYYLQPNESISFKDALYTSLLQSANDSANVIAENISGTIEAFVDEMNKYTNKLNLKDTHFTNPSGLHSVNHYTSAFDMAQIAKLAYKNEIIKSIASTREWIVNSASNHKDIFQKRIYNLNRLIRPTSKYYYEYANGLKSGYTSQAKNTLVATASKDSIDLIAVILHSNNAYEDVIKLLNYCYDNYYYIQIIKPKTVVDSIYYKYKDTKIPIKVYTIDNFEILVSKNQIRPKIEFQKIYNSIYLPLKKDSLIGKLIIKNANYSIGELGLYVLNDYKIPIAKSTKIAKKIVYFIGYLILFIILLIVIITTFLFIFIKKDKKKIKIKRRR